MVQKRTKRTNGKSDLLSFKFRFHEVLTEQLHSKPSMEPFELADWIDELLFNEFNLILEDDSSDEIARNLVQCAKWLRSNEAEKLAQFIGKLPPDDRVLSVAAQSSRQENGEESDNSSESEGEDEPMEEQVSQRGDGGGDMLTFSKSRA